MTRHNPRLETRPLTIEDYEVFYNIKSMSFTTRGYAFYLDGALAGIGGIRYENGYFLAFSDIKPDIVVPKATVLRCGLKVMKMIKDMGITVVAVKNKNLEKAGRFLTALGFEHTGTTEANEEIYAYG